MVMYLALISYLQRKKRRRKVRRRRKGDVLITPDIPLDLQMEILTRLPSKSLMRFKCVSKLWSCLIRSRFLSNRHLTLASPPRQPRLYMSFVDHQFCNSMEICHNPYESELLSFSSSSSTDSAESLVHDLTLPGMGGDIMMVLRGLIINTVCRKACIYNPATRQSVTLPAIKSNLFAQEEYLKSAVYFLGHDPVLDQYKVVCTVATSSEVSERITSEHWVFVLEAGDSWKRIEFDQLHIPTTTGLCINGVMYYCASTCNSRSIVVSFDVRSEEFNMIQVPHVIDECTGLVEYCGKPAIFDHTNLGQTGLVDLCVLGDGGKWSKKSLVLQPRQMHLVDSDIELIVQGTTQNGEVILAPCDLVSPYYILYYDLQKNDMRKVIIRGIPKHCFRNLDDNYLRAWIILMDKNESIVHLET